MAGHSSAATPLILIEGFQPGFVLCYQYPFLLRSVLSGFLLHFFKLHFTWTSLGNSCAQLLS